MCALGPDIIPNFRNKIVVMQVLVLGEQEVVMEGQEQVIKKQEQEGKEGCLEQGDYCYEGSALCCGDLKCCAIMGSAFCC